MWKSILVAAVLPISAAQAGPRDLAVPMQSLAVYDQARLIGNWFEVAQTPSFLEQNCHGTTVDITARDDSRLTLKMACHKSSLTGAVLPVEGVLAETNPAVFQLRLIRLLELGNMQLVVLYQSQDDSMTVIGSPEGHIGWIWSKTPHPDAKALEQAKAALVAAGYDPAMIQPVEQAD